MIFLGVAYFLDKIGYVSKDFPLMGYHFIVGMTSLVVTLLLKLGISHLWYYKIHRRTKGGG
jgi:hypothetical protein